MLERVITIVIIVNLNRYQCCHSWLASNVADVAGRALLVG